MAVKADPEQAKEVRALAEEAKLHPERYSEDKIRKELSTGFSDLVEIMLQAMANESPPPPEEFTYAYMKEMVYIFFAEVYLGLDREEVNRAFNRELGLSGTALPMDNQSEVESRMKEIAEAIRKDTGRVPQAICENCLVVLSSCANAVKKKNVVPEVLEKLFGKAMLVNLNLRNFLFYGLLPDGNLKEVGDLVICNFKRAIS